MINAELFFYYIVQPEAFPTGSNILPNILLWVRILPKSVYYYDYLTCNIYALLVIKMYGLMILIMHLRLTKNIIKFLSIFPVFVCLIIFHAFLSFCRHLFKLTFTLHENQSVKRFGSRSGLTHVGPNPILNCLQR